MAYERTSDANKGDVNTRLLGDGLDSAVQNAITLYQNQVTKRDNEDEANFQALVAAGTMSLDDQLAYRKEQLSRTLDPDSRATIRTNIATLSEMVNAKKFSDTYTKQLADHAAGVESIDSVISWLQDQLTSATDQSVKDKINTELVTQQGNRFTAVQNMLRDQTNFALNDKSDSVISTQLDKLNSARNTSLLAGDQETAANLNLQIQSLKQTQQTNSITRDMQNFAVSTVSGGSTATGLLDAYNAKISSSDQNTPLTVNGVTYANASQFWTYTRDSYLADSSSSGFFTRMSDETTTALKVKNSNNTLTPNDVTVSGSTFNTLYGRPELANYSARIDAAKQNALQTSADFLAKNIEDKYQVNGDLKTAVASLNALKASGVNVDDTMQKILNDATTLKSAQVTAIMQYIAQNPNPGKSITDQVTAAIQAGATFAPTPDEVLNKTPGEIAAEQLTKNKNKTNVDPQNATIPSPTAATTTPTGASAPGGDYMIKGGDTLSKIALQHNTTVDELAKLNNITDVNKIQAGVALKIPGSPAQPGGPTAQPTVTPVTAPLPSQTPKSPVQAGAPQQPSQPVQPAPKPVTVANPTPTAQSPTQAAGTYTIKSGDTLSKIAAQHGTTVADLAKLNGIADPNKIQSGVTLKLL